MELVKEAVPYTLIGGVRFFQRKETLDILSLIALTFKQEYGRHLLRLVNFFPGVSQGMVRLLYTYSKEQCIDFMKLLKDPIQVQGIGPQKKESLRRLYDLLRYLKGIEKKPTLLTKVRKLLKIYHQYEKETDTSQAFFSYCTSYEERYNDPSLLWGEALCLKTHFKFIL